MKDNLKNIIVSISFVAIITAFMFCNIIFPDNELSYSERRKLEQVPEYSEEKLLNGELFSEYEDYFLDQFLLRDSFRTLASAGRFYLMGLKDNNDIYLYNNGVYKMEYPLNETSVMRAAEKFNGIKDNYLINMNIYYSIIPDKNHFVPDNSGYLHINHENLNSIFHNNIKNMTYIDIYPYLDISDYFRTDLHWQQNKITDIADALLSAMNNGADTSERNFISYELSPFYGSYYGQSAIPVRPDKLTYLTDEITEKSSVYNGITATYSSVYIPEKFNGIDSYNLFLDGAQALLTIENPLCDTGKELYLFRDSFGSSIAPLLLSEYSKITLIDIRYISSSLLGDYVEFKEGNDVLFLYNTLVLNESAMLK